MSNRYLIYEMIGSYVRVDLPARFGGKVVKGVVEDVYRDVINGSLIITIDGRKFELREPKEVAQDEDRFILAYGDDQTISDKEFFTEAEKVAQKGYGMDEAFRNLDNALTVVVFEKSEIPASYKKRAKKKSRRR